jgi:kynureninase
VNEGRPHEPRHPGERYDEEYALELDASDPLSGLREQFHFPSRDGRDVCYMTGNSLGLQPRGVGAAIAQELEDWQRLGVEAHFDGRSPWYSYHEQFRAPLARLVGARPGEVVAMNALTVNLHLLLVSFYRPAGRRVKILIESNAFPSDLYAVRSQLAFHGHDPDECLLVAEPREGEQALRTEDVESLLDRRGEEIALLLFGGVNFVTGQLFDLRRLTAAAQRNGCVAGFDLAHAAGNVPLQLHDWGVDFAAWCSYKYLNAGPGAVAGCFVHERHGSDPGLPRFAGWWGNDPETRFRMQLQRRFVPVAGADGWQLSNPPILALAPLKPSLELFDEAGIGALREKSLRLTGYL